MKAEDVVVLLDVDNTLLDNDRFAADLDAKLEQSFGDAGRKRYWTIYESLRDEVDYADYLGALQRLRFEMHEDADLFQMSAFMLEYPFAERLYPRALDAVRHLETVGRPVVLSDGDMVFQPRKIQRAGISDAVNGRVLIYLHKERELASVQRRCPARHYLMIEDKPHILASMKRELGSQLTTVFVDQGHHAANSKREVIDPAPDVSIERIADINDWNAAELLAAAVRSERQMRKTDESDAHSA